MKEHALSDVAIRALDEMLMDVDFGAATRGLLLDDVLEELWMLSDLTENEVALKSELEAMADGERELLSREIAVTRKG